MLPDVYVKRNKHWNGYKFTVTNNDLKLTFQIQDSEASEILFRMSAYECLNTMLKSNSYTLKVSAPANRNVRLRKSKQNRVWIGVDTSFCEADRK